MARKETVGPASPPSTLDPEPLDRKCDSDTAAPAVLVIAPPNRVLFLSECARRLLAETRHPEERGADAAVPSELETVSRSIRRLSARIFQPSPLSRGASTALEIKGLTQALGAHLRVHGLILHDRGDLRERRAVVMFDRASPR